MGRRKTTARRLALGAVVPAVLVGGWLVPEVGLVVPAVMAASLATAARGKGRRFCGHLCPRGSFLDGWLSRLRRRPLPALLGRPALRVAVAAGLMGFLGWRLATVPLEAAAWGRVFWMMCLVTTAAALLLALLIRPRAWCTVCPVGTLAAALPRRSPSFRPPDGCRGCGACDRTCPVGLTPSRGIETAALCVDCDRCTEACPALRAPSARTTERRLAA